MFAAQQVYEASQCGVWKNPYWKKCGCNGSGWFLSDVDTWHECSLHSHGMPHPEYELPEEAGVVWVEHHMVHPEKGHTAVFTEVTGTNHFNLDCNGVPVGRGIHRKRARELWAEYKKAGYVETVTDEDREADRRAELEAAIGSQW